MEGESLIFKGFKLRGTSLCATLKFTSRRTLYFIRRSRNPFGRESNAFLSYDPWNSGHVVMTCQETVSQQNICEPSILRDLLRTSVFPVSHTLITKKDVKKPQKLWGLRGKSQNH